VWLHVHVAVFGHSHAADGCDHLLLLLLQVQQALLDADMPPSISYRDGWEAWHSGGNHDAMLQPKQQKQQQLSPASVVLPAAAATSSSLADGSCLTPAAVVVTGCKCGGIGSISEEQPHARNGAQEDTSLNATQSDTQNTRDASVKPTPKQPGSATVRAASSRQGSTGLLQRPEATAAAAAASSQGVTAQLVARSAVTTAAAAVAGPEAGKKHWWRQLLRHGGSGQLLFKGLRIRMGLGTGHVLRGQAIQGTTAYTCARGIDVMLFVMSAGCDILHIAVCIVQRIVLCAATNMHNNVCCWCCNMKAKQMILQ
jgi:hypothetical protein